ncbi:hypothetical protein NRS6120_03290 [Bacillus subtilis]|nr:hypothetical protein NRS6120_03799 [Bacillus subtilis]CAI6233458.1 hypothetical protein NRS6120_03290 [Bacillus subtilis]
MCDYLEFFEVIWILLRVTTNQTYLSIEMNLTNVSFSIKNHLITNDYHKFFIN